MFSPCLSQTAQSALSEPCNDVIKLAAPERPVEHRARALKRRPLLRSKMWSSSSDPGTQTLHGLSLICGMLLKRFSQYLHAFVRWMCVARRRSAISRDVMWHYLSYHRF